MAKLSRKALLPYIEEITPIVNTLRIAVEKIPESTKRKSLMLSVINLEKKLIVVSAVRELSESAVIAYLETHPEVKAKFANSDSAANEVLGSMPSQEKKKKRF
jgi:hypothetical protein